MSVKETNPIDAFEALKNQSNAVLIDVRTFEEFNFVGTVNDLQFKNKIILLPWQTMPNMTVNENFINNLENTLLKMFGKIEKNINLFFLCKSGGRSMQAASYCINCGYQNCYNIISGFEGDLNDHHQRGKINGWKASNLPWGQR
jgi:rhodanese-related sulfurtransferase